jgi:Flp pilus assembly protein TadG
MPVRLFRARRDARGARRDRGAAAVEFALVLPILLVIVFGLIQYGLYFYSAQTGSNTVNAAARQLSVGNCDTATELNNYVDARLGAASTGSEQATRTYYDIDGTELGNDATDAVVGGTVQLDIQFDSFNLNFPFVPFLDDPIVSRSVTARVEDTTDQGCGA